MGKRFKGVVHLLENKIYLYEAGKNSEIGENIIIDGVCLPVDTCKTFMPLLYCPLTNRIKARRSWCFGSILA
jgi:hypothetical protein